ncbi:MAG: DUF2079 domain-containing protein [Chloroflexi bacterium]|nr:MAG: DUF2079 domain-containing protein [Chloroflexota bacterium]
MFAASLCAGMTRVKGPSSMGTGYENATRSVMKAAPHEKTMRPKIARHIGVDALPLALALLAAIVYGSISVYRHNVFASGAFDLGVQDQTVWGYSQLEMIPNTVEMIRNLLGDHFHPILMTIAPLYWIWNDVRVLLIAQAVLIAAGGVPIFWWARQQLGLLSAIAFEIAYLVFWGVLSAVVYDFHHIAFAVPAVSFGLYAVLTKNNRLLWAMVVLGLLTRENIALTFAAIGVFVMLAQHRWRLGAALLALCVVWFVSVIEVIMPAIAGAPYGHWTYQELGSGPGSALLHIVRHPISSLALLFNNTVKLKLWGGLLGAWLFLPILSPLFLVAIPTLLERLWSSNPALWSASFHYSLVIAPVLAFAAIDTLSRIRGLLPGRLRQIAAGAVSIAVLAAGLVLTAGIVRPLDELGTYTWAGQAAEIQSCLDVIPPSASVSASDALLPHLSHRREIYLLTMRTDADYVAIDLASYGGHFFAGEQTQIRDAITRSLAGGYGVACSKGTTVVLRRGGGSQSLSEKVAAFLGGG